MQSKNDNKNLTWTVTGLALAERLSLVMMPRRSSSYQTLAGHTNDIRRGLLTRASPQVTERSLLCPASILSHPKEPIIPGVTDH